MNTLVVFNRIAVAMATAALVKRLLRGSATVTLRCVGADTSAGRVDVGAELAEQIIVIEGVDPQSLVNTASVPVIVGHRGQGLAKLMELLSEHASDGDDHTFTLFAFIISYLRQEGQGVAAVPRAGRFRIVDAWMSSAMRSLIGWEPLDGSAIDERAKNGEAIAECLVESLVPSPALLDAALKAEIAATRFKALRYCAVPAGDGVWRVKSDIASARLWTSHKELIEGDLRAMGVRIIVFEEAVIRVYLVDTQLQASLPHDWLRQRGLGACERSPHAADEVIADLKRMLRR